MLKEKFNEKFDSINPGIPSNNVLSNEFNEEKYTSSNINTNASYHINCQNMLPIKAESLKKSHKNNKIIIIISTIIVFAVILAIVGIVVGVLLSENNLKKSNNTCMYRYSGKYCDECGVRFSSNKIVGGHDASERSWPFIALIIFKYRFNYEKFGVNHIGSYSSTCAGTLINRNTIVTAAHCFLNTVSHTEAGTVDVVTNNFHPTLGSMYTVYLGMNNISEAINSLSLSIGQKVDVSSFTIHPEYNAFNNLNDIGIIKLNRDLTLDDKIQIACLPDSFNKLYPSGDNIESFIAGWGVLNYGDSSMPNLLKEAAVKIYASESCGAVFPTLKKNWDSQICAGKYEGGVDTCQGDSGGPIMIKDSVHNKQKYVLVGVTSYGDGCGEVNKPGIYTRVSYYLDWIIKNL